jgi:SAM-dependent methyltransferase
MMPMTTVKAGPEFCSTRCAICDTEDNATELYPERLGPEALSPSVFSARRLPDRIHYRIVKCNTCGLVRSDPTVAPEVVASLYSQSSCTYGEEVASLRNTYRRYLASLSSYHVVKGSLLEIGCGNGFFLEEARAQGYAVVWGVEPSTAAIAQADSQVRPHIVCDTMRPGLFASEQFDVICLFQVLDHIPDPGALLDECLRVLKSGGVMLCINHNIGAASARLLKDRSPIIDIEHTYLYSPATISRIAAAHGFAVRRTGAVHNTYSLHYLARLMPLPAALKRAILAGLRRNPLRQIRLTVPLGNLYLVAEKPRPRQ